MLETKLKTEDLTFSHRRALALLLEEDLEWLGSYKTSGASLLQLQEMGLANWVQKKGTRDIDRVGYWQLAKGREPEIHATRSAATLFYIGSVRTLITMLDLIKIGDPRIYGIKPASIRCLHRYKMLAPLKDSKGWKLTELGKDAAEYMLFLDTLPNPKGSKRVQQVTGYCSN